MNRKSEGNQRKNFPSKDEIIHIHLKGMRNGARYLPISIGFGLCLADSFGNLTACPGENKVNDNTVSSPSSNFVSEMFRFVETFQIRMNEASHLISARQKSVGEVHHIFFVYKKYVEFQSKKKRPAFAGQRLTHIAKNNATASSKEINRSPTPISRI